jgi:hypothetical protein
MQNKPKKIQTNHQRGYTVHPQTKHQNTSPLNTTRHPTAGKIQAAENQPKPPTERQRKQHKTAALKQAAPEHTVKPKRQSPGIPRSFIKQTRFQF